MDMGAYSTLTRLVRVGIVYQDLWRDKIRALPVDADAIELSPEAGESTDDLKLIAMLIALDLGRNLELMETESGTVIMKLSRIVPFWRDRLGLAPNTQPDAAA